MIDKGRKPRIDGNLAFLPLTKGYEAVIDLCDLQLVGGRPWCALVRPKTVYVVRNDVVDGRRVTVYLHRLLTGVPDGVLVDHKSGDGLDNRRDNIRPATKTQNNQNQRMSRRNTSGIKGVAWDCSKQKWQVGIGVKGQRKHLGRFSNIEDAAAAYENGSKKFHGEFGRVVVGGAA